MNYVLGGAYGPPKTGKTLSMLTLDADFYGIPGGLQTAAWFGRDLHEEGTFTPVRNITEANKALDKKSSRDIRVFDDLNYLMDAEMTAIKESRRNATFWDWTRILNERVIAFVEKARWSDSHVLWVMHEQPPKRIEKNNARGTVVSSHTVKGCPLVPGYQLPERFPGYMDFVARVTYSDRPGWPYVYDISPSEDYVTGDRGGISGIFPPNMAEILRFHSYDITYPKGFEWIGKIVEPLALKVNEAKAAGEEPKDILRPVVTKLSTKYSPKHVRWAVKDIIDRAELKRSQAALVDNFLETALGSSDGELNL